MARISRRRSLGGGAAVLGGLLAAACGEPTVRYVGQPQAGPAGPAGPQGAKGAAGAQGAQGAQGAAGKAAEAPIFLFYLSNLPETHPEGAARVANLEEFNETNELNIRVDLESGGRGSTRLDKYKTMSAGGTPPDVAFLSYFDSVNIFASGATADLDQLLKTHKDWAAQRADIFPRMLESSMWGGKLAGMPVYTNNAGLIYNKGRLQQAGVSFPQWDGSGQGQYDWNGFKEDLARMQQQPGIDFAFSFRWTRWFWFLGTLGARVITDDGRKITIDRPESVETIDYLQSILKGGFSPPDGAGELYREAKNNIAFEHQGPFRIPTMRKNNAPDFGVLHTPVHPGKREVFAQNGGHNMAVFKGAGTTPKKQEASALVCMWMNSPHPQAQACIRATSIPVSRGALESKELQDYLKTDEQMKGFVDMAPYGWRYPGIPSGNQINRAGRDISPIMKGEIGVQAWLADTQSKLQAVVDKDWATLGG